MQCLHRAGAILLTLAAVVFSGSVVGSLHAQEPGLKTDDFTVLPLSVSMNSSIRFDDLGRMQVHENRLSLQLRVTWSASQSLLMVTDLRFGHAITDANETLRVTNHAGPSYFSRWERIGEDQARSHSRSFPVFLGLQYPDHPARRLKELTLEMDVLHALDPAGEVVAGPVSELEGRKIKLGGIADEYMVFTRTHRPDSDQHFFVVEITPGLEKHIVGLSFLDEQDKPLLMHRGESRRQQGMLRRVFRGQLPDTAKVRLQMHTQIQKQTLSFSLRDIPLIYSERNTDLPEVILDLKPADSQGQGKLRRVTPTVEE